MPLDVFDSQTFGFYFWRWPWFLFLTYIILRGIFNFYSVIYFLFRAGIMVLDYIITVWDAAEPKTYNSKVSWKKNMPLNEKLWLWLKSINIQKSWKKNWHQFFIRWISSSSLPTAQYTTNYFFFNSTFKVNSCY